MSRFHSYITSASKIIGAYSAGKPLSIQLKNFFAADKKFGSRDRKTISALCYNYFRTGHAFKQETIENKILYGLFLCENKNNELLQQFNPELNNKIELPVIEKMAFLNITEADIFPFNNELGDDISGNLFSLSFLRQPLVYLRIRLNKRKTVEEKLHTAGVKYELPDSECIQLANNVSVDDILNINKEVVVQDINSQKVLNYLDSAPNLFSPGQRVSVWDCCAASGGKSILLFDKLKGNIQLSVSDIRENILANLSKRLSQAGININNKFIADLSGQDKLPIKDKFSIIVCDAPCTGSGTWSRTPEQLLFFDKKIISDYAEKQKNILSNTVPFLKEGGLFFYITCSVFKEENEEAVEFIKQTLQLQLMKVEYLKGYERLADTMFVAVFSSAKA